MLIATKLFTVQINCRKSHYIKKNKKKKKFLWLWSYGLSNMIMPLSSYFESSVDLKNVTKGEPWAVCSLFHKPWGWTWWDRYSPVDGAWEKRPVLASSCPPWTGDAGEEHGMLLKDLRSDATKWDILRQTFWVNAVFLKNIWNFSMLNCSTF